LFDAWLHRTLGHDERLLSAWRALFFLKAWRQHLDRLSKANPSFVDGSSSISSDAWEIMERVCTSLILLIEVYATWHPTLPLQPWNLTTRSLEHWFGEARRLHGEDFTLAELLYGTRTQDLRSAIFHHGDPRLQGVDVKKTKCGYQYSNSKRIYPGSQGWKALARYPTKAQRQKTIPHVAFKQVCALIGGLGMDRPKFTASTKMSQRDMVPITSRSLLSNLEDGYSSAEDDNGEEDVMSEETVESAADGNETHAHNRNIRFSCREASTATELQGRLDDEEEEASAYLEELREAERQLQALQVANEAEENEWEPAAGIDAFDPRHFSPSDIVTLRKRHDPAQRLNSERTKACAITALVDDDIPSQSQGSQMLREHRDIMAGRSDRDTRARMDNARHLRWITTKKHIDMAMAKSIGNIDASSE
jgi:hypothetical protein